MDSLINLITLKKKRRVIRNSNINILLTSIFFNFSQIFLSLPDDCCTKTT